MSDDTRRCEETEVTGEGGDIVVNVAASSITTIHFAAASAEAEPEEELINEDGDGAEEEMPAETEEAAGAAEP